MHTTDIGFDFLPILLDALVANDGGLKAMFGVAAQADNQLSWTSPPGSYGELSLTTGRVLGLQLPFDQSNLGRLVLAKRGGGAIRVGAVEDADDVTLT